ncbi:hypothetical protein GIB67_011336 [Kingdonia uniflora]|uniref:Uncharacterized protein n=1 Tax=Kingdonia uniflora TaxID=39325 RepID=A0A7J7MNK0_9MAGN|nr:hypothetical protein GIB67_011336 [Kingdonia uniflora]
MFGLTMGDIVSNLEVEMIHGKFKLHDFIDNQWVILFSHLELGQIVEYAGEFKRRGVKLLDWLQGDMPDHCHPSREIMQQLNMVDPDEKDEPCSVSSSTHGGPGKKLS